MRIKIPLTAGQTARQSFRAQSVVIVSTGAAASVDFNLAGSDWQDMEQFGQCERLFGIYDPARTFSGVELTATVDCVVELIVSRSRVDVMDGATVTATLDPEQWPLPVRVGGVATINRSGAIAVGGTPQSLAAANAARSGFWVQNLDATNPLWVNELGAASQDTPSLKIAPGGIYESPAGGCPLTALSIVGPVGGQKFSAREW